MQTRSLRVRAPAKLNLHLRVGPPTADGFHPLMTWMVTVGLFDNLTFTLRQGNGVSLACAVPSIPVDDSNLIIRAAKLLQMPARGVHVDLTKRIPSGGGLGGGSSDGAVTLLALNQLWQTQHAVSQLSSLASTIGSDLSFFLHGTSCICTGRGEIVRQIAPPSPKAALLLLPSFGLATADVYRRFDAIKDETDNARLSAQPDWSEWTALSSTKLLSRLANDLEPAAFSIEPRLGKLRIELERRLARIVRMSGSGSSLFTLYDTFEESQLASTQLSSSGSFELAGIGVRAIACELCPGIEIASV